MHLLLDSRVNQGFGAAAIGAWQRSRSAEQAADQRALVVHRATVRPQVHAVELVERCLLLCRGLARQARHLFGRRRHRPTTIMATRHAGEGWNLPPQIADFLAIAAHCESFPCERRQLCISELQTNRGLVLWGLAREADSQAPKIPNSPCREQVHSHKGFAPCPGSGFLAPPSRRRYPP